MNGNLIEKIDLKHLTVDGTYTDSISASATVFTGSVDLQNFQGVLFSLLFGDSADGADCNVVLQISDDNSTFTDVTHTTQNVAFNASDNKVWALDAYRPLARYARLKIVASADDAVLVNGCIAVLYGSRKEVVEKDTSSAGQFTSDPLSLQFSE